MKQKIQTEKYATRLPRRYFVAYVITIALSATFFAAGILIEPGTSLIPCLFRFVTGIICPSCGITTSVLLFFHGEIAASLRANPFGPFAIVVFAAAVLLSIYGLAARSKLEWLFGRRLTHFAAAIATIYIVVWLVKIL